MINESRQFSTSKSPTLVAENGLRHSKDDPALSTMTD